jgi:hypothetical protein
LEELIDDTVKTGADLSKVLSCNYANSHEILASGSPIPALLDKRLSLDWSDKKNRPPSPRPGRDHGLDQLERGVKGHV